jgi:hypothetical protein
VCVSEVVLRVGEFVLRRWFLEWEICVREVILRVGGLC